jgi:CubicO group peptidase (beta-lactamase class C family)
MRRFTCASTARARAFARALCLAILLPVVMAPVARAAAEPKDPAEDYRVRQALRLFEEWADATVAYEHVPGASMGLVLDQQLIWSKGFGYADRERHVPATPDTLYGICSISKLFTAISVLQLRDAGKLRLDDPVSLYLPYANLKPAGDDASPPTIRSLLTHSSGFPRESAHAYWTDPDFTFPTEEEVIAGLKRESMLYPPDRYFQYSNLGMTLAGEIVEKVSGKPYEEYVEDAVLKPLSLAHTTPFLPEGERGKLLATGYGSLTREGTREVMPFYRARGITPAAGFASNVRDLAAFASWQFRSLGKGGTEVLRAATLRDMQRVHWVDPDWKTTWGLGFSVRHVDDQTIVGHSGQCPGYFTTFVLNPRAKEAVVVMMNAMNVDPRGIALQLLKIAGPALKEAQGPACGPVKTPDPSLERFAGLYRSAWGETVVVPWKDGLAALDLPSREPMEDLTLLKHIEGNAFRRIREDSDDLGEEVVFETDPDGKVMRLLWHQNVSRKIR